MALQVEVGRDDSWVDCQDTLQAEELDISTCGLLENPDEDHCDGHKSAGSASAIVGSLPVFQLHYRLMTMRDTKPSIPVFPHLGQEPCSSGFLLFRII
ncbi:hypothetical protein VZT92_020985 [Zoarces viviparus]|uniref:Uncharacterized protein n=1 Tax=Zoarces viviparus TaxID=48416 RepID=A0AAW1EF85_ZOAVI